MRPVSLSLRLALDLDCAIERGRRVPPWIAKSENGFEPIEVGYRSVELAGGITLGFESDMCGYFRSLTTSRTPVTCEATC
jgi:hypothetical protein